MKIPVLILPLIFIIHTPTFAQRNCGFDINRTNLIAKDPAWAQRMAARKASLQQVANANKLRQDNPGARKTTSASPIPVIFHFMVTNSQLSQLGGTAGVERRVDSQIVILNRDFNRQNSDSVLIPSGWKSRYASSGIQFGLAHTRPDGYGTPGYDITIIPESAGGFSGFSCNYCNAKHASGGGVDAWDVSKYINIWCLNFTDISGLLGLTTFMSEIGTTGFPADEEGLCINYIAVGNKTYASDTFMPTGYGNRYDRGRTITHEMGHFFEIWHTWGDDGGQCPWDVGGGDDGLADTPPESGPKFGAPADTVSGGTIYDGCRFDAAVDTQHIMYGAATHNYMNYVDDIAMFMFTTDQAAVMAAQVSDTGENHSLVTHPELLNWSPKTEVASVAGERSLSIFPNPTTALVNVAFDGTTDNLYSIEAFSTVGQQVLRMSDSQHKDQYTIDLSGLPRGIYFIRCNFASGSVTRKILLQ